MPKLPRTSELATAAGISKSYASEILSGARSPARSLAIHIFRKTGWRHASIAALTAREMKVLEAVEPWKPRPTGPILCASCDLRADSPQVRSCTRTDCPLALKDAA